MSRGSPWRERLALVPGEIPEQVVAPAVGSAVDAEAQRQVGQRRRAARLADQAVAGLVRQQVSLSAIAGNAAGDDVLPILAAAARHGNHVVERELRRGKAIAA